MAEENVDGSPPNAGDRGDTIPIAEVAETLDVSRRTVRVWIERGDLRAEQRDGQTLVARAELQRFQWVLAEDYHARYEEACERYLDEYEREATARGMDMLSSNLVGRVLLAAGAVVWSVWCAARELVYAVRGRPPGIRPDEIETTDITHGPSPIAGTDRGDRLYGGPRPFDGGRPPWMP